MLKVTSAVLALTSYSPTKINKIEECRKKQTTKAQVKGRSKNKNISASSNQHYFQNIYNRFVMLMDFFIL